MRRASPFGRYIDIGIPKGLMSNLKMREGPGWTRREGEGLSKRAANLHQAADCLATSMTEAA